MGWLGVVGVVVPGGVMVAVLVMVCDRGSLLVLLPL